MNRGDKIKVVKGDYTAWEGHVLECYGSSWVAVEVRYRDLRATITVPPEYLQVIAQAKAPAPRPEQWEYYTPDDEDEVTL